MAGRGRGRGKSTISLSGDQMGFGKTEVLPPILQPPPSYPPLEYKPLPTVITNELRYLQQLKKDFTESMHESANNVQPIVIKKDIERYSDRYQDPSSSGKYHERYDWSRMPAELKPEVRKRKGDKTQNSVKKKKDIDIESKLQELEKKEITAIQSDVEEEEKNEDESEEKDVEDKVEEEEEEIDEEMDEGTDYVNNYFDNGENYEDDEENLDDGAIF